MAVKQKWLFSVPPIILNGPIHQADDMFANHKNAAMSVHNGK
jgi:hypothetical protein